MKPTQVTHCTNSLDFSPRQVWPSVLPAYAWRGLLLCAFGRTEGLVVDLGDGDFVDAFHAVYPSLSLIELGRLDARLPEELRPSRLALWAAYGLRLNDRLSQIISIYLRTPTLFQEWSAEKAFGPRDLSPLLALPDPGAFASILESIARSTLSKSDGARLLELAVEINLAGESLHEPSTYTKADLVAYERRRRPRTSHLDEERRGKVESWPWPAQTEGRWKRFGDEAGLEIRLRARSPQDLEQKLARLNRIGQTWSRGI